MKLLSRSEEIVLLAIWKLQDNAYGISIRDQIKDDTGKEWTLGAIYAPLHRLQKKRLVITRRGDPVPERGGRSKVFYKVSEVGKEAMRETKKVHEAIWSDIPSLGIKKN
jgi:DNA-binding PadR family transcriptional regulator